MSYTTLFVVGQTDTLPVYTVALTDAAGNPVNLSTATTVTFTMSNALAGVVIDAAPVTIVNAAAGVVQYSWSSASTTTPGIYAVEWGVVWSTGLSTTYPLHDYDFLMVVNDLAIGYPDVTATFNTIWTGTAAPTSANGNNGDFWYNETSGYFYGPKVSGIWPAGFLLSPSAIPINELTAPNGNLSINNFKLTNVGNGTNPTDGAAFGQIPQLVIDVTMAPYSADPTGATSSLAAIQNAINVASAAGGGIVYLPPGNYSVTPVGSPLVGLSLMGTGSAGMRNVRLVGAGYGATVITKGGPGTLLQLSGPSTSPSTGSTHTRYCSVEQIGFAGGGYTGNIFQCYYADNIEFRDVMVNNNADIILDSAEFWDSRFYNCVFGGSGSATANADAPNVYIRDSAAASGFGNSTGSSNMIVFHGCRWEAFTTGAMKIAQGVSNSAGPNSIFISDCKMETSVVNGGSSSNQASHLIVDTNSRGVFVKHLYLYSGGFQTGFSTAADMVNMSAQSGTLDDVLLSNGGVATVANGITVNSPTVGQGVTVENVSATWSTNPTGALINYGGSAAGTLTVENYAATGGTLVGGTIPTLSGGITSTTTVANTGGTSSLTNLFSQPIPGLQAHPGSVYRMTLFGIFTTTGTPTLNWQLYWGGTNIGNIPAITTPSGVTNALWKVVAEVNFRTATSCVADIELKLGTSTSTDAASIYLNVPVSPVSVTTASSQNFTVAVQWQTLSTASISLLGGFIEKVY